MKKWCLRFIALLMFISCAAQRKDIHTNINSLLWQISGNGLKHPSYLFGTIHMFCKDDAVISNNVKTIIADCDEVYFEVDMDNMFEMIGLMNHLRMRNDTTLADLLDKNGYERVKKYFENNSSILPFSMLETYKPLLAVSTLMESNLPCKSAIAFEQLIMEEAKRNDKNIKGLETMAYQAGIFDSIPYQFQAEQLLSYVDNSTIERSASTSEFEELTRAYKSQDLNKLEELSRKSDLNIANFTDILLYKRNKNWVGKLNTLLPTRKLFIAVGAGHLPGTMGIIQLLRNAGYSLMPMQNKME